MEGLPKRKTAGRHTPCGRTAFPGKRSYSHYVGQGRGRWEDGTKPHRCQGTVRKTHVACSIADHSQTEQPTIIFRIKWQSRISEPTGVVSHAYPQAVAFWQIRRLLPGADWSDPVRRPSQGAASH